jgi:hypothetical protein
MTRVRTAAARIGLLVVAVASAHACSSPAKDGEPCNSHDDCASEWCTEGYCGGGECRCGEAKCDLQISPDCHGGWRCSYHATDALSAFFGGSGRNRCVPTCGSCPPSTHCPREGKEGQSRCLPGRPPPWVTIDAVNPVPVGEPATLHARASSENGDIVAYAWVVGGEQEGSTLAELTYTPPRADVVRVEVTVEDQAGLTASANLLLRACVPRGAACRFQGSSGECCDGKLSCGADLICQ